VLAQTIESLEVLVVIDGPDPETASALAGIADPRVRILARERSCGASAARNHGAKLARGEWVAFLDDDDEWLPSKLERQLAAAAADAPSTSPRLITSCCLAKSPLHEYRWPRRVPRPGEPLGDYLFRRHSLGQGDAGIQTSTIMVERAVFAQALFDEELRVHEDWEWMLRAQSRTGMRILFVDEPLSTWRIEEHRPRLSDHQDWRFSLQWAQDRRREGLISGKAFASFCLTRVATAINPLRNPLRFLGTLPRALSEGVPTRYDFATWLGAILPPEARRTARRWIDRLRGCSAPLAPAVRSAEDSAKASG